MDANLNRGVPQTCPGEHMTAYIENHQNKVILIEVTSIHPEDSNPHFPVILQW